MKAIAMNLLIITFLAILLSACGSRSSDFPVTVEAANPLPPCPDTPNCVRITRVYPDSLDAAWEEMLRVLEQMKPYDIEMTPDEYRVDAVFLVVFFRDDMVLKLEPAGSDTSRTYVHIRSSSRLGSYDFGVNRKRVQEFLTGMNI